MTVEPVDVALSFMRRIIDELDVDGAIALLSDDFVGHQGATTSDRDGMRRFGEWLAATHPQSRMEIHRVVDGGGLIAIHHTDHHDAQTAIEMIDILSVDGGRITECWIVMAGSAS